MRSLLVLLLASTLVACGAAAPATAAPRRKPPGRAVAVPRAPRVTVLGAATAERVKKLWEVAAGGYGRAVAVSTRVGKVAFASKERVELFDLATGKPASKPPTCKDVVRGGLAFHDADLVVVCEGGVTVLDPRNGPRPDLGVHTARITAAALSGSRLALGHRDGVIRIYGLDGAPTVEVRVPGPPIDVKSLALSRDGSRLAVAWVQGSVWWWDLARPDVSHDLVRNDKESDSLAFGDDSALLAEEGAPGWTTLWQLVPTPVVRARLKNGDWVKRLLFTRDGKWLVRAGSDGLELAEIGGARRVALDSRDPVEDAALDETGSTLAAVDRKGRLTVWAAR